MNKKDYFLRIVNGKVVMVAVENSFHVPNIPPFFNPEKNIFVTKLKQK